MALQRSRWWAAVGCVVVAGCASPEGDDVGASADEVVGVGDLALLERTFGLTADRRVNGSWSRDVTKGPCYAAYVRAGSAVEYRRYAKGAAFFEREDDEHRERGEDRPVLCVDLDDPGISLDGVGLDAVFRFDLGAALGRDSAPGGEASLEFQRGRLHVRVPGAAGGPSKEEVAARRADHGATLVESPLFIGGELLDVTVDAAKVYEPFSRTTVTRTFHASGSLAAFAYVAAYAKTGSAFSLTRDPLGALSVLSGEGDARALRAQELGDGPGWWQAIYFPIATVSEAGYFEGGMGDPGPATYTRTFRLGGPSNPALGYVSRAEIACELVTTYASVEDQVGAARPIACEGL
ncbi:MAG: hypothetical protein KIS78_13010 [Labilithrix sp.]|nr:hypothetical protein [Labilithrix sp.]MCW5833314.1 hypothetical protein [Labilithrix sp.]